MSKLINLIYRQNLAQDFLYVFNHYKNSKWRIVKEEWNSYTPSDFPEIIQILLEPQQKAIILLWEQPL